MKLRDRAVLWLIRKAATVPQGLQAVGSWVSSWWGGPIRESFSGAWQRNVTVDSQSSIVAYSAVYTCITGIANDIGKLRIKLSREEDGIWTEITRNQPWLPLFRKPNHYQITIEFLVQWIVSKLLWGNTYILKQRDGRDGPGVVNALYVLNPQRVQALVAENGEVFYQLQPDTLSQVFEDIVTVPASEIIHDKYTPLWHPLVGVSPIYACGISATMGNKIQSNSTNLFANMSRPSGILSTPDKIDKDTAQRYKEKWEEAFTGANSGRIAVLGNGLKFEQMTMPAEAQQLIEQLKWTVEDVGRAFHYPLYKLGGPPPPYSSSPDALTTMYYTDCLQILIELVENLLDDGLELPAGIHAELDLDNLLRMDTAALYDTNAKGVGGSVLAPNEARFRVNLKPVTGGESPMIQEQNFSLAAIAKRDAQEDPFASKTPPPAPQPAPQAEEPKEPAPTKSLTVEDIAFATDEFRKGLWKNRN
jgi:HK97 family phage portal protein